MDSGKRRWHHFGDCEPCRWLYCGRWVTECLGTTDGHSYCHWWNAGATILATVVAEGALALEEHMDGFQIRS